MGTFLKTCLCKCVFFSFHERFQKCVFFFSVETAPWVNTEGLSIICRVSSLMSRRQVTVKQNWFSVSRVSMPCCNQPELLTHHLTTSSSLDCQPTTALVLRLQNWFIHYTQQIFFLKMTSLIQHWPATLSTYLPTTLDHCAASLYTQRTYLWARATTLFCCTTNQMWLAMSHLTRQSISRCKQTLFVHFL